MDLLSFSPMTGEALHMLTAYEVPVQVSGPFSIRFASLFLSDFQDFSKYSDHRPLLTNLFNSLTFHVLDGVF